MATRKKVNLPLIESLTIAVILHVVALFVLGGITIWQYMGPEEPDFEPPPPVAVDKPPPPPVNIRVQQQQQVSARPVKKITVKNPAQINLPSADISLPNVNVKVGVGSLGGGRGFSSNFDRGDISFDKMAVDFFGIKSKGERLIFIVDTSKYMLEDDKGGLLAYRIVKDEIIRMINQLPPGTLFNVLLYEHNGQVEPFAGKMVPATPEQKQKIAAFLDPVNEDPDALGNANKYDLQHEIEPIGTHIRDRFKGLHVAFEMNPDAVFFISGSWSYGIHKPQPPGFDNEKWLRQQGWDEKDQERWDEAREETRKWLDNENKKRKAKGQPPKIVHNFRGLVREITGETGPPWHDPGSWDMDDLISHFRDLAREVKKDEERPSLPEINVVVFRGKDEGWSENNDERLEQFTRRFTGDHRVLEGLEGLQNVTSAPPRPQG